MSYIFSVFIDNNLRIFNNSFMFHQISLQAKLFSSICIYVECLDPKHCGILHLNKHQLWDCKIEMELIAGCLWWWHLWEGTVRKNSFLIDIFQNSPDLPALLLNTDFFQQKNYLQKSASKYLEPGQPHSPPHMDNVQKKGFFLKVASLYLLRYKYYIYI